MSSFYTGSLTAAQRMIPVILALLCFASQPVMSQEQGELRIIQDRSYQFQDGNWFSLHNGEMNARIEPTRVIVRRSNKNPVKASDLTSSGFSDGTIDIELSCGYTVVSFSEESRGFEFAQFLSNSSQYEFVGFDVYGERLDAPANDFYFPQQWNLQNNRLAMPRAWSLNFSSTRTIVAIIDSGADLSHPDYAINFWPSVGYDFLNDDGVPEDNAGHGTAVTGIIGARVHNDIGVAGIAGGYANSAGAQLDFGPLTSPTYRLTTWKRVSEYFRRRG